MSSTIKALEKPSKAFVSKVAGGYRAYLHVDVFDSGNSPWAAAYDMVRFLDKVITGAIEVSDNELMKYLAQVSYNDFETLKADWDNLSREQRDTALRLLDRAVSEIGLEELLSAIGASWRFTSKRDIRSQIVNAAKKYLNGEIDWLSLAFAVENVYWPTVEAREAYKKYVMDFREGMTLAFKVSRRKVKALLKKYILSGEEQVTEVANPAGVDV